MYKIFFSPEYMAKRVYFILLCFALLFFIPASGQKRSSSKTKITRFSSKRVIYGLASFYADKFNGRRTANGEIFSQRRLTCACNMLPFGTLVKITNVHNGKSVIVKVNDRLHSKMRRLVDLSKLAAKKIGALNPGLVRVKAEVIGKKKSR